jgi:hypothetical protein
MPPASCRLGSTAPPDAAALDALFGTSRERDPTSGARATIGLPAKLSQLSVGQHHTSFHDR